uniref:ULP_PROTEASE domain-containing protein n=1 Tax=Heterorhabditis bacteriophora TaxID=37862 RepID=A0A1I7XQ06_HETBA
MDFVRRWRDNGSNTEKEFDHSEVFTEDEEVRHELDIVQSDEVKRAFPSSSQVVDLTLEAEDENQDNDLLYVTTVHGGLQHQNVSKAHYAEDCDKTVKKFDTNDDDSVLVDDDSSNEVQVLAEFCHSPRSDLRTSRKSVEYIRDQVAAVSSYSPVRISPVRSDSICSSTTIEDNDHNHDRISASPSPEDSVSRQATPRGFYHGRCTNTGLERKLIVSLYCLFFLGLIYSNEGSTAMTPSPNDSDGVEGLTIVECNDRSSSPSVVQTMSRSHTPMSLISTSSGSDRLNELMTRLKNVELKGPTAQRHYNSDCGFAQVMEMEANRQEEASRFNGARWCVVVISCETDYKDTGFGIKLTRRDLLTLCDLDWLNDEVINFYLQLVCERSVRTEGMPKVSNVHYFHMVVVYAFNTFFYSNINSKGYASVKRWTRKVDIFSYEILLVPIHLNVHWCMAIGTNAEQLMIGQGLVLLQPLELFCVIDLGEKKIDYYDSLLGRNQRCLDDLKNYLMEESKDKKKQPFDFTNWKYNLRSDIPRQLNGSDCGVFSCKFAEFASRRKEVTFNQEHMPYYRQRMVYELVNKKLL